MPTRLELPKLTTLKMHHYSVLGRTRDVEASWPAMRYKIPFLTPWFSVANYLQHIHGWHHPFLWEMPMWGSEAAAQHVARTLPACSSLPFLPYHLRQAVPWPHTSAKNLIEGLKLFQAREKNLEFKKWHVLAPQSQQSSPWSLSDFRTCKACFQAPQPQKFVFTATKVRNLL